MLNMDNNYILWPNKGRQNQIGPNFLFSRLFM